MRSPRLPFLSTGIFAIAGLGMALGSAGFKPGHRLHPSVEAPPPQAPPNEIPCKTFLAHGVDKSNNVDDAQGKDLTLYRTKGYYEHASKLPKWIGAVKIKDDGSKAFPGLRKGQKGCLYFQPNAVGDAPAFAQLWDDKGEMEPYTYRHQLLCNGHAAHSTEVEPDWKETPDDCNTIQIVLRLSNQKVFSKTWPLLPGRKGAQVVMGEIEDSLKQMGVPTDEIERIKIATAAPGPWYPCAETGCCRAYEDQ